MTIFKHLQQASSRLAIAALATGMAIASHAGNPLPASLARAQELAAMPDGGWLTLDKQGLRLLDSAGNERATFAVRARHLDTRSHRDGALAIIIDADTQRPLPFIVNLQSGQLQAQAPFPAPPFAVEAACLYRDAQQLDQLFLIGKEGHAEQWIMQGSARRLVRTVALPAQVKHCRSDDATHTLFVSEADMGVWAYRADAEGPMARVPVVLRQPYGPLRAGAGAIQIVKGGIAVLDQAGQRLHLMHAKKGQWRQRPAPALGQHGGSEALALRRTSGGDELLFRDEQNKQWKSLAMQPGASTDLTTATAPSAAVTIIEPSAQTDPMTRLGDAADDPAIWIHPLDATRSRVLGTNKKQGLLVYDLQGKQQQLLESGRLNNVDVRQNVRFNDAANAAQPAPLFDLAMATQRDDNSLVLYAISTEGEVSEAARFATGMDKIYGFCLYQPRSGGLEAFVNDKDGIYHQYRITRRDQAFSSTLVRQFKLASQPEGCIADDKHDRLFVGEEKRGVWVTSAKADQPAELQLILPVGAQLTADTEGMAIYFGREADYLIVSSQGDHSYVVMDAQAPYRYRGKFRIGYNMAAGIDGTSETDGLDVTSAKLGSLYQKGMLVVQDGYKRLPDGAQNFKYVAWEAIERALQLR